MLIRCWYHTSDESNSISNAKALFTTDKISYLPSDYKSIECGNVMSVFKNCTYLSSKFWGFRPVLSRGTFNALSSKEYLLPKNVGSLPVIPYLLTSIQLTRKYYHILILFSTSYQKLLPAICNEGVKVYIIGQPMSAETYKWSLTPGWRSSRQRTLKYADNIPCRGAEYDNEPNLMVRL